MPRTRPIQEPGAALDWTDALGGRGPRYLQVLHFLERAIADGRLRPGDRLPPQRQLARQLGLDLTTVTRVYAEASARQLIHARGALGTFVSAPMVELSPVLDLGMNMPPPPARIDVAGLLKDGMAQVLAHADIDKLVSYQTGGGSPAERAAGARWLAPMLGRVDAQRMATAPGAQAALAGLVLALTRPGDRILTEAMTYPGLIGACRQLGRSLAVVERDAHGMRPDALASACREGGAGVLYLNPTLHNPTATTMPEARRRELAQVAARHDLQIIEDDPYWLLAEDPPPPVAHWAPERTHYLSTLSKCLAPGLRTAYVASPSEHARKALIAALRATTLMPSPLATAMATQWIHDGTASQWLQGVRAEARMRQELAEHVLADGEQRWPRGAIHLWYELPRHWTPAELALAARMEGLAVTSSDAFAAGTEKPRAIRISLGGIKQRYRLEQALRTLVDLLGKEPAPLDQTLI